MNTITLGIGDFILTIQLFKFIILSISDYEYLRKCFLYRKAVVAWVKKFREGVCGFAYQSVFLKVEREQDWPEYMVKYKQVVNPAEGYMCLLVS